MDHPTTAAPRSVCLLVGLAVLCCAPTARGQEQPAEPLRVIGLYPEGVRQSVTGDSHTTLRFTLVNSGPSARVARVVVYYIGREDVRFARDVWVPPQASISTLLPVGPAPLEGTEFGRDIGMILYDRTDGTSRVVLPPGEQRERSRTVFYKKRGETTAIYSDVELSLPDRPSPDPVAPDVLSFVRLIRQESSLDDYVTLLPGDPLPLSPEAYDGVDVFVLAGNRLAADPAGRAQLRRWVMGGGRLWVMLDRVEPATVAAILGEDFDVGLVDRVGLTSFRLYQATDTPASEAVREVEQPVPFARVTPAASDRVISLVDGWPAAFSRPLGHGRVVFTTLGGPGWVLPRTAPTPQPKGPPAPPVVPHYQAKILAGQLHPPPEPEQLPPETFAPMLADEIGYSVIGRGTAAAILGVFALVVAAAALVLRRSRRPELVGWLVPAAGLATAAVFVVLGERSRRAVPPTVGVAGVALVTPGTREVSLAGLYATYHTSSGPVSLGTDAAASFEVDAEGLAGQTRTRVQTDADRWHWDGLSLPAGVRTGRFRMTPAAGRIAAVVRFGPAGLEGRLETGSFGRVEDAIITTPARDPLAVATRPDGTFAASSADSLPQDQYLAGTVLTDRQQRRQAIYRDMLSDKSPPYLAGCDVLLAWAGPTVVPITVSEGTRVVGSVLLAVPLEYERTPPGTNVVIPRGFTTVRRVQSEKQVPALTSGTFPANQLLRFQVPASVLPFEVERAVLVTRVSAPARRVTVSCDVDGKSGVLFDAESPTGPLSVEITDPKLLRLDEGGGMLVNVNVGAPLGGAAVNTAWAFEAMSLELIGRTAGR